MADEPAPQAEETASGGDAAAPAADAQAPAPAPEAPPAKPSMLPLILTPILCAASAFGVIHFAVNNLWEFCEFRNMYRFRSSPAAKGGGVT